MIIFDIETGPDEERLADFMKPFQSPDPPGEFDPDTVKCGNIGGPESEKGQQKIQAAREKHEAAVAEQKADIARRKSKHETEQRDRAGLDPVIGRVLTIGYFDTFKRTGEVLEVDDEKVILADFWQRCDRGRVEQNRFIGHCIHQFDLPFLMRRSWIHGIAIPEYVMDRNFRYFDPMFVDTFKVWQCGSYGGEKGAATLDRLSRVFGDKGKEGVDGSQFARLWSEDRPAAKKYVIGDLRATKKLAEGLGLL